MNVGKVVKLEPKRGNDLNGCVVISYLTWPFKYGINPIRMRGHTNAQEVVEMANSYLELGFRVEICDWGDRKYCPPKDAKIAIDLHSNLDRWKLPEECLKILHATGAHWLFQNRAELERLEALRIRKGVVLHPNRLVQPSRAAEEADYIVVLGNEFTAESFDFTGKAIVRVPISSAYEFSYPQERDQEKARRKFLWIGSYGMVHKGLDLVLEAFAGMPELDLTVCGRPEKEDDFFRLYEKELKNMPNIHFQGWCDMGSPEFAEIARSHASVIYPSCSEGGAGSVIHCMHAGMVPICTRESSIDLMDFGILIKQGSVKEVQVACTKFSEMSAEDIEIRARKSYNHVRKIHTHDQFAINYRVFARQIAKKYYEYFG